MKQYLLLLLHCQFFLFLFQIKCTIIEQIFSEKKEFIDYFEKKKKYNKDLIDFQNELGNLELFINTLDHEILLLNNSISLQSEQTKIFDSEYSEKNLELVRMRNGLSLLGDEKNKRELNLRDFLLETSSIKENYSFREILVVPFLWLNKYVLTFFNLLKIKLESTKLLSGT